MPRSGRARRRVRHRLVLRQALPQIPRPNSRFYRLSSQSWAPWCGPARALSVAVDLQRCPPITPLVRKQACGVACASAACLQLQRGPVAPMRSLATSLEPVGLDLGHGRGRAAFHDRGLERDRPNRGTAKWYEPQGLPPGWWMPQARFCLDPSAVDHHRAPSLSRARSAYVFVEREGKRRQCGG